MEKVFWLKILCRLFYTGSFVLVAFFFYLGMTGNKPGTDWRGGLLFYALLLGFLGLLGDVVGDIADDIRRRG
jgi:hypothetical protein